MSKPGAVTAVTTVIIDRPERGNALDLATCRRLSDEVADAAAAGARVIVVTGAGPHFCAGIDLTALDDGGWSAGLRAVLDTIRTVAVPVVAAVHGAALGAGTQLALACDLRVVAPTARFGIPAAKLGLMVDHWTVRRLAALAGHATASAMLLAAEQIDAEAAIHLGLAQRRGDLAAAQAWAAEISALAPLSLAGHKLSLNALLAEPGALPAEPGALPAEPGALPAVPGALPAVPGALTAVPGALPAVAEAYRRAWSSADAAEGRAAFAERRPPRFHGT